MKMLVVAIAALVTPATALACGGVFCAPRPTPEVIRQDGERILFAHDDDGRMVAVIQIAYDGPPDQFSWILPVSGRAEVSVASDAVFDALDAATAPVIQQALVRDGCEEDDGHRASCGEEVSLSGGRFDSSGTATYRPRGQGSAGPYDYAILPGTSADAAIGWLLDNGYFAPPRTRELLLPYIDGEHELVALKLRNDATTGQIVPVVVRSDEPDPCVPLRLTGVAATEEMPILVWILGEARAAPTNYATAELNFARLDFRQGGINYEALVSEAVDEAPGGMAFVTQFAGRTPDLRGAVSPGTASDGADPQALQDIQRLLDTRPYLTRLYTRISPGEMLDDPIFVENPDLPAVTRRLTQELHSVCEGKPVGESPVRVDQPDGSSLWFPTPDTVDLPFTTGPAARYVIRHGREGAGVVLTDGSPVIDAGHADPRGCGGCQAPGRGGTWLLALGLLLAWRRVRGQAR